MAKQCIYGYFTTCSVPPTRVRGLRKRAWAPKRYGVRPWTKRELEVIAALRRERLQ